MAKSRIGRNAFAEELLGGAKEGKPERAEVRKSESNNSHIPTSENSDIEEKRITKSYRLTPDLVKRVRLYAAKHGLKLSQVVEAALEAFLQE